ncbi:TetR family transcriptional regulator [Bacillus sp. FJAT-27225]|uniref:TetR/AcrR family transcriptional regulator n=1 Tax=Bacillus sp. FJAT-27225 TaxID=1743144 RepID=UPI00080C2A65|nr:TetR/AcrR family transcriptional regulator [Bacillus sp. FJAT-27225]OCA83279.1 TetR family transcriptional regulator [Bacillus sp. FJAT-27225]
MNDRKQHVIKTAHKLFIEKGFQSTSIQDILDLSGISKGTFYNYFSSKNELLIALIKSIRKQSESDLNELLIGQKRSDINVLIKQVELHLKTNRTNKLLSLYDEAIVSNDPELKNLLRDNYLRNLRWIYHRFIDIFGEEKKQYLLDCSVLFLGILQQNLKIISLAQSSFPTIREIVKYSVNRIVTIVEEVSASDDQLFDSSLFEKLFPFSSGTNQDFRDKLHITILAMKKQLVHLDDQKRRYELLDFIEEELMNGKVPRIYVIESAIDTLRTDGLIDANLIAGLEQFIKAASETE